MTTDLRLQERYAGAVTRYLLLFTSTVLGCATIAAAHAQSDLDGVVSSSSEVVRVPLFLSGFNPDRQGLVRIINHSEVSGGVAIYAIDETGARFGPVNLLMSANSASQLTSSDLAWGNPVKGVFGTLGFGVGDWRLEIESELDIAAFSYARTPDGFISRLDAAATVDDNIACAIAYFNPASEPTHASSLRLTNLGAEASQVVISGLDDAGQPAAAGAVNLSLASGESRRLSSRDLEYGATGLRGQFGTGIGIWRLSVIANQPLQVMNLLEGPVGILSVPADCHDVGQDAGGQGHSISAIVNPSGPGMPDQPGNDDADSGTPIEDIDWITDPYELVAAGIQGDSLKVTVSYGGGCRDHKFDLEFADAIMMMDPPRLQATLLHDADNDPCEAWLTEDLAFDLTPVKALHGGGAGGGTVVLQLISADGSQRDLVYTF